MVLIDDQAVCLVCGASPPSGGDPAEQEKFHSHSHPHTHPHTHAHEPGEHTHAHAHEHGEHTHEHVHEAKAEPDDITKLRVLLPYWIEHNEEHAASFQRWATKARELGRQAVAERIEVAVAQMETCNEALAAALEML
ncbi:MAG: zinc transporter [Chloroflexota bacterium]|nr:MAG: zinc transporter [Chloroflexota bacterium]